MASKKKPAPAPYDKTKPLYDAHGNKFDSNIHLMIKGQPAQNREGLFKYKKKFIIECSEKLGQKDFFNTNGF